MPATRPILYVDSCSVIEALRTGCWKAILAHFEVHMVRECWNELGRGNPRDPEYVKVDLSEFAAQVVIHDPDKDGMRLAAARSRKFNELDPGERDLLAHCASHRTSVWLLTTGDRAAIVSACELGFDRQLVSLEEAAARAGSRPRLEEHHRKSWLSSIRTMCIFDSLE
jgi:hypothetical protein